MHPDTAGRGRESTNHDGAGLRNSLACLRITAPSRRLGMTLTNADIDDPALPKQDDLAPWLRAMVDVVRSETTPTAPLYVPEITLLLATEAVPLRNRIERSPKLNRGLP